MVFDFFRNQCGKSMTVYRQTAAGLYPGSFSTAEDQTAKPPQFFLEKAYGIFQPVSPQGVGAYQFSKMIRMMGRSFFQRAHLNKLHGNAPLGQLPCCLGTGKARAYDFYFCHFFVPPVVFFAVVFFAVGFFAAVFFAAAFFAAGFLPGAFSALSAAAAASASSTEAAGFL